MNINNGIINNGDNNVNVINQKKSSSSKCNKSFLAKVIEFIKHIFKK